MLVKKLNSGKFELNLGGTEIILTDNELMSLYISLKQILEPPEVFQLNYEIKPPALQPKFIVVQSRGYQPLLTSSLKKCYNEVCGMQ